MLVLPNVDVLTETFSIKAFSSNASLLFYEKNTWQTRQLTSCNVEAVYLKYGQLFTF